MTDTIAQTAFGLPPAIRSRFVENINGMTMHVLEAGFETPNRPCVLLLHGFPELAYSWRKVMQPIAEAGFHVVAPDQRGYGRTTGWDGDYDADLEPFRMFNLVRDAMALLAALGYDSVHAVIGHDFGSPLAAYCALTRPDIFRTAALMSAPFGGAPSLNVGAPLSRTDRSVHDELAALDRPRKHYQWYYSTREANGHMRDAPQSLRDFMRAYSHFKSADWPDNKPYPLDSWSAPELAKLPTYYVMDLDQTMAETVVPAMPSPEHIAACTWLPDDELRVFSTEFARTGFQGGLNWYRCMTGDRHAGILRLFAGRTIDVPSCFIAGQADWGIYQKPGDFERMQSAVCTRMTGCHIIPGAGHWVQQEQPEAVTEILLDFLRG